MSQEADGPPSPAGPDVAPADPTAPWLTWAVGERVVVRHRIDPPPEHGPAHTDVLGDLVAVGPQGVTVRTRTGDVTVPAHLIAVGKRVPPPPPPRRRRLPRAGRAPG